MNKSRTPSSSLPRRNCRQRQLLQILQQFKRKAAELALEDLESLVGADVVPRSEASSIKALLSAIAKATGT